MHNGSVKKKKLDTCPLPMNRENRPPIRDELVEFEEQTS